MTPLELLRDEHELEWYFSRGQIAFEHSTIGGMLDRAELFSICRLYHAALRPVYDAAGRIIGHALALSARPTSETHQTAGYVPDSDTLQRYAHVSALLKRVDQQSRRASQVLELLYGDMGQRWAANEPFGRIGALFHLTAKGQSMLADARKVAGAIELSSPARMESIVVVQRVQPQAERGQCLAYCHAQAKALEMHARGVWLSVKHPTAGAA